jgi:hypothetical protein
VRKVLIAILVLACLAVIAIPAFFVMTPELLIRPSQLPSARSPFSERDPAWFRLDSPLLWLRLSPFGAHAEGWQGLLSAIASWVYLYLTSALMLALVPRRVLLITQRLQVGGWRAQARLFVIGLLAALASALLALLARYAFVWIALIVLLSGAVLLLVFLGILCISLLAGRALRRWAALAPSLWVELAIGSLIVFALGRIPFAGWILFGIVSAWGLGAVLATHLGSGEAWSLRDWQTEN